MSLEEKKAKKLSLDNFSKLLTKRKKTLSSSMSTLTLSDSVLSRNSTIQSSSSSIQETVGMESTDCSASSIYNTEESEKVASLKQQIQLQRQALASLEEEAKHYNYQNNKLSEQLSTLQLKSEKRLAQLQVQRTNYQQHILSLRCTNDDPVSISNRLIDLRQHIHQLASELVLSPRHDSSKFKTLWLNLADPIDKLDFTSNNINNTQMLTEKFMMDVLIQNLNTNYFPGLTCNNELAELQDWLETHNCQFYSTRLRQEIAIIVTEQAKKEDEKEEEKEDEKEEEKEHGETKKEKTTTTTEDNSGSIQLEQAINKNWQHLYRGLQRVYPILKDKQERVKLHKLVKEACWLGMAIKGQENLITAVDVREGSQPLDPVLMDELHGKQSGVVTFCISPPFVIKMEDRYHTLVKGRVFCQENEN